MELASWRQLSDRGPDLVPCLDFPGARAAAGFAELAAGVPAGACFLHVRGGGGGPLAASAGRWAGELLAAGRPVRAVLGYCAGTALATRVADAVAAAGPPPVVVLFDAVCITGGSLAGRYDQLIRAVAGRLPVPESLRQELTGTFTAYLDYLLLASQGGFEMRAAAPLFVCSAGYEPPVPGARAITLDISHDDLLRAPAVHELVADLLTGEHRW